MRLFHSDVREPLNIGSEEMVSMNEMAEMALELAGKSGLNIHHIPGPEGVRGRNSDNTKIKELLGWAPSISLKEGLTKTFTWIQEQIEAEKQQGVNVAQYSTSTVVHQKPTQ